MKTKLDYYRIFYETARFRSFSTAAQHLYISQSAISQCIQQLESDLGVQLFIRTRKGISLTNEGKILFSKVESAICSLEQGEKQLDRLRQLESGELRIAAGDTITTHFLLKHLEDYHATYPDIRIEMANSYSSQMTHLKLTQPEPTSGRSQRSLCSNRKKYSICLIECTRAMPEREIS